ncbi:MAG TPA: ABC transporter permease [Longimicrobiaceae bacterium]
METLLQDLRYAARRLASNRGFTLVAVVTLALGIGANSAIFSVVNAVLLRPLPFAEPDRLDHIYGSIEGFGTIPVSPPDFLQMQDETRAYERLAAYTFSFPNLTGEGEPVRLNGTSVSATFFDLLGVRPALGRTFAADESDPGRHRVAVVGHALWQERFGGSPAIIGRTIQLNGQPYEVIGVMRPGFHYPGERELWVPLEYDQSFRDDGNRDAYYLSVIGRRGPDVTLAQGAADMASVAVRLRQATPGMRDRFGGTAVSLREELVGEIETPLLVLLGAVGLVLLIACVNVANLLLARAVARESELAVRSALGAERGRLVRQLLTESLVLGLLGGALGLLLSVWGTEWLLRLRPEGIPRLDEVGVDWRVVGFTAVLAALTGLLFGLAPAYQVTRGDLASTIREGGRGGLAGRATTRTRGALVVVQTALAVTLLSGAGLLIRSFAQLSAVDPGFRTERAMAVDLSLPSAGYPQPEQVRAFYAMLEERVRGLPGVESAGLSSSLPMGGFYWGSPLLVDGLPEPAPGEDRVVQIRVVTPGLLPTMGVPVLRGRGFLPSDGPESARVALLTESAAARYLPGRDPVGMRVAIQVSDEREWAEVVGIVGDVRGSDLTEDVAPGLYFAHAQQSWRPMSLVLRTRSDPMALLPAVRREVQALDAALPIFNARTLEQALGEAVSQPRFYMLLLSIFGATALALSAIGIFGVMSYSVVQRTREIGIRIALGAAPEAVLRMVVGGAVALALGGVAIGLMAAAAGTRILSALLFEVSPTDPLTLVSVALILTGVAVAASFVPARRAVRVDPMVVLRQ